MGLEMLFLWLVYFCLYEDYNSELNYHMGMDQILFAEHY